MFIFLYSISLWCNTLQCLWRWCTSGQSEQCPWKEVTTAGMYWTFECFKFYLHIWCIWHCLSWHSVECVSHMNIHVEIALAHHREWLSGRATECRIWRSEVQFLIWDLELFLCPMLGALVPNHLSLIENHLKEQKWLSSYKCAYLV